MHFARSSLGPVIGHACTWHTLQPHYVRSPGAGDAAAAAIQSHCREERLCGCSGRRYVHCTSCIHVRHYHPYTCVRFEGLTKGYQDRILIRIMFEGLRSAAAHACRHACRPRTCVQETRTTAHSHLCVAQGRAIAVGKHRKNCTFLKTELCLERSIQFARLIGYK